MTPAHEVLLTNPPYSGEHKEKIYRYLLDAQRDGASPRNPTKKRKETCRRQATDETAYFWAFFFARVPSLS
jgi:hypothetical protein|eukprot:COSAG06_NODE_679_length_13142_cov_15.143832_2_plen_71_part_00